MLKDQVSRVSIAAVVVVVTLVLFLAGIWFLDVLPLGGQVIILVSVLSTILIREWRCYRAEFKAHRDHLRRIEDKLNSLRDSM